MTTKRSGLATAFALVAAFAFGGAGCAASHGALLQHHTHDDIEATTALQIGDLDGGGIYVGKSATTGKDLHAALGDEPECKTYEGALAAAEQLKAEHPTAHVPTPEELDKNLYANRNAGHLKGTFNTSGSYPASLYRSAASSDTLSAQVEWFDVGIQNGYDSYSRLPVRLVW